MTRLDLDMTARPHQTRGSSYRLQPLPTDGPPRPYPCLIPRCPARTCRFTPEIRGPKDKDKDRDSDSMEKVQRTLGDSVGDVAGACICQLCPDADRCR